MAMGFVTVLQLFSGSIRSVSMSEQYLKATTLAQSKMGELEMNNYRASEFEGTFANEENYRWQLDISPYTTSLNSEVNNIQLSEVLLRVLWSDANKVRNVELSTLKVDGALHPSADSLLVQSFSGGTGSINQEGADAVEEAAPEASQNICGSTTSMNNRISGASTTHISGN
ncbi:uncharacterized protein METZ01_LOCUS163278 [marine metagenome]|uniref:Uncharacterized protein n=1 Tax=marine metagenome TaxID=408172 RepID=A0A382B9X7_9ZZZZ